MRMKEIECIVRPTLSLDYKTRARYSYCVQVCVDEINLEVLRTVISYVYFFTRPFRGPCEKGRIRIQ